MAQGGRVGEARKEEVEEEDGEERSEGEGEGRREGKAGEDQDIKGRRAKRRKMRRKREEGGRKEKYKQRREGNRKKAGVTQHSWALGAKVGTRAAWRGAPQTGPGSEESTVGRYEDLLGPTVPLSSEGIKNKLLRAST